jgi:hypothetical protein
MFHWTIWLGISFGVIGVFVAFIYTLIQILQERGS